MMTMGYNASIGFDRVVEFQGLWLCFEFLTHNILCFLIPFLLGYSFILQAIDIIVFWQAR